ncbi:MAG: molecular chaperone HtpG [Nitrospirae bacterium]|nr:molecular chaperone HtpG [Nitrospirota bacterium]
MTVQQMEFKTEVKQLLDLMIHSLYSHKEIFLRELISNSSDAIDKARYESLTNRIIMENAGQWKIKITPDRLANTLMISDNGIGMTKDEMIESLGTIAHSGTREFLKALKERDLKENPELIGQFGVGFYSSFMVADKVTVISKKAGIDVPPVLWESHADGTYTVGEGDRKTPGTDVILHLKADEKKYLDEWELRNVVRKYSDYIEHPIVMDVEKEKDSEIEKGKKFKVTEEETLNSQKAIWLKDRSEVTEKEYHEFYRHISHSFDDPAKVMHYRAEGTSEFTALLFIPSRAPFGIFYKDFKLGPTLYVKRVQIMDHCEELIPPYLRFVKGVVDSSDLPLNISREILQANRHIDVMKKNITKKVLDALSEMKKDEYEKYLDFYREFGKVLKEGIHYDLSRKEQVADLLLFPSTKTGAGTLTTMEQYVNNMKPDQEEIFYITGSNTDEVMHSPYIEAFREKEIEVLIMLDDIDDILMGSLFEYKGKKLKSVVKGDVSLDSEEAAGKDRGQEKYGRLISVIKEYLKEDVQDVRISGRLRDSACCLVTGEGDIDPKMEKILRAMGQDVPAGKRVLEINPGHPLIESMSRVLQQDEKSGILKDYSELLYNQALLLEGSKPKDPVAFTRAVTKIMVEHVKQAS